MITPGAPSRLYVQGFPPASGEGPHDYYNHLCTVPGVGKGTGANISMRIPGILTGQIMGNGTTKPYPNFEYLPPGTDAVGAGLVPPVVDMDACRFYLDNTPTGPGGLYHSSKNIIRDAVPYINFGITPDAGITSGSIVLTLDLWIHRCFKLNRTEPSSQYKPFRWRSGGTDTIWSAFQIGNWTPAGFIAKEMDLFDSKPFQGFPVGLTGKDPVSPGGLGAVPTRGFDIPWEKWLRIIWQIELDLPHTAFGEWNVATGKVLPPNPATGSNGLYNSHSEWVIPENGEPIRLLYKVPFDTSSSRKVQDFCFNWQTSTDHPNQKGPIVAYKRNLWWRKNYILPPRPEDNKELFRAPVS
jgi:hypothetical protein